MVGVKKRRGHAVHDYQAGRKRRSYDWIGELRRYHVDLNGDVMRAEAPESESPIVSSRLLPFGGLELTSRGGDPDETITVALKLIDAKTGSVRFKAEPGDTLVIKPIAVHKNRAQNVP